MDLSVVVADPDDARRARRAAVLRDVGCSVIEARGASEAVRICRAELPVVVVIDEDACRADDLRMIDAIKRDTDLFTAGVVVTARRLDVDDALDGLARGAHDVLVDPVSEAELAVSVRSAARTGALQEELRSRAVDLERLAYSDGLTGVPNRRFLERQLQALVSGATRHGRPLAVALVDLDHFKAVNDGHGHAAGDVVLTEVARRIAGRLRASDHVGRFGGEEFLVLLPDTDADAAAAVTEGLREEIARDPVRADSAIVPVTASIGWATWDGDQIADLLARADEALYRAKAAGRDRVVGAPAVVPAR